VALLRAGLHGAALNVDINLGSLADAAYVASARADRTGLAAEGTLSAERAESLLRRG
jgi:formiminotetrahydrofolate cyclodeaminase